MKVPVSPRVKGMPLLGRVLTAPSAAAGTTAPIAGSVVSGAIRDHGGIVPIRGKRWRISKEFDDQSEPKGSLFLCSQGADLF
jgi:hypothetical protein